MLLPYKHFTNKIYDITATRQYLRDVLDGPGHFGATKSAKDISAQHISVQVKLGEGQTRQRSNSAQVKLCAGQTLRRSNSAQVKLGAGQTRRRSESAQKKMN